MSFFGDLIYGKNPGAVPYHTSQMPGQFYGNAKQYMDPSSRVNRQHFDRLRNQASDMSAQQGLLGFRGQAAGINPFANEQNRQQYRQGQGQALGAYTDVLGQQQGAGLNMMGLAMQGEMGNMQAANQAEMMRYQAQLQRDQNKTGFWGGLLGQLGGAMMPIGGAGLGALMQGTGWSGWGQNIQNMMNPWKNMMNQWQNTPGKED